MKKPQLENGYIRIANELWEALGRYRISGEEWLVLNCIIRKTYGFNKKQDKISLSQLAEYTGLNRPAVARSIKKLVAKGVIKKDNSYINIYWFNKLFDEWIPVIKKDTTPKSVIKKDNRVLSKKITKVLSKKIHTKDNKDTITKDILLRNSKTFGNPLINEVSDYFLKAMQIPKEDVTQRQSRQYWQLLLKESKKGVDGVRWLIDLAKADDFYGNNITSSKDLYYKRVKLIARKRGDKPLIAVMK